MRDVYFTGKGTKVIFKPRLWQQTHNWCAPCARASQRGSFQEPLGQAQRHCYPSPSEAAGQGAAVGGNCIASVVCLNVQFSK